MRRASAAAVAAALFYNGCGIAHAADLPLSVEPIDYVAVCSAYGVGYAYIPGADTCMRISGRVRANYSLLNGNAATRAFTTLQVNQDYRSRARAYIFVQSRSETEFGLLLSHTEVWLTQDNSDPLDILLRRGYFTWGPLTFGKNQSFYDFVEIQFTDDDEYDWGISDVRTNLATANFDFGGGLTAGVSIEDAVTRNLDIIGTEYAGNKIPDVVARIHAERDVGILQLSAAAHQVTSRSFVAANPFANGRQAINSQSEIGVAVTGGGILNLNLSGRAVQLGAIASYARGAVSYVSDNAEGGRCFGGCNNVAISSSADGVIDVNGELKLSTAWTIGGGFAVDITDRLHLGVNLSYLEVDSASVDTSALFNVPPGGGNNSVDLDFANIDVQSYMRYRPFSGMEFGAGVEWKHITMSGGKEMDALHTFVRAERTF